MGKIERMGRIASKMKLPSPLGCQKGSVLLVAAVVALLLALMGMYSASLSTMGARIAANNKLSVQALYTTQAGIEEARTRLPTFTQAGAPSSSWRRFIGTAATAQSVFRYNPSDSDQTVTASMQNDLDYTVQIRHKTEADCGSDLDADSDTTDVVFWGDRNGDGVFEQNTLAGKPIELLTSVGRASGASDRITVEVLRDSLDLKYAVFGDKFVDTKDNGTIWKGVSGSPYVASIGSNESIEIRSGASIYGEMDIGRSEGGSQGTYANNGGTIWGSGPNYTDRIDPDPLELFVADSDMDKEFIRSTTSNDNDTRAVPAIGGTALHLGNGGTMTLHSGNYYLSSIRLDSNAILTVDVTSGPVNIYLGDSLETQSTGAIELVPTGSPPGLFTLYCKAEDTSLFSIDIKNGADFHGVIYAPRANISLRNHGDMRGMVWGRMVDIKNSGDVLFDPRLKKKFLSPKFTMQYWKEER